MQKFAHVNAETLQDALGQLGPEARPIAGGTDLLTLLKPGIASASLLVNIKTLADAGLRGISPAADGGLEIGALVTLDELDRSPLVRERYPALAQAAGLAASPQLRNMATLGGNMCQQMRCWYYRSRANCWLQGGEVCFARDGENSHHAIFATDAPCVAAHPSDPAVALIALGAEARVAGEAGERSVPAEQLFALPEEGRRQAHTLAPGELIAGFRLPAPLGPSHYLKSMDRQVWAFALASVAIALQLSGDNVAQARVVLGGVAPIPWRRQNVEDALVGGPLTAERIKAAAALAVQDAAPLRESGYKVPLVRGLVEQALSQFLVSSS
jgi:xanthine dehydrogenase YagS FAD-binding subunit